MPVASPSQPVVELLDWISRRSRSYPETMEAWKTHCPRLSAWEDALAAGLVAVRRNRAGESRVVLTQAGAAVSHAHA